MNTTITKNDLEAHAKMIRIWAGDTDKWEDKPINVGWALMVARDIEAASRKMD